MGLYNLSTIKNMSISEKLEINIISLFDWGFLEAGAYFNVDIDQSGAYVDNMSILTKVTDVRGPTYWQGPKNWVFEDTIDSSGANTPAIIYVSGIENSGALVNYRDGRVLLGGTQAAGSVRAYFSYKWVNFTSTRKIEHLRRVQYRQTRTDLTGSSATPMSEINVPLPFVAFDVPPITKSKRYGIGLLSPKVYNHDVIAYVVGESHSDVSRICDTIAKQEGFIFDMFDPQLVHESGDYPLNMNGTINSGKTHNQLSALYPWCLLKINSAECTNGSFIHEHIYQATVKINTEMTIC